MKPNSALSLGALLLVFFLGTTYIVFGVLGLDPLKGYTKATMMLANSGGLSENSPVLLTGVTVGKVTDVRRTATAVEVSLQYNDRYLIPVNSSIRIENLSALGETYVNFTPDEHPGRYIEDDEVLDVRESASPTTVAEMSTQIVEVINQFNSGAVTTLINTIDTALRGTETIVPKLERSTKLLASTILSRNETIRTLLIDLQTILGDAAWTKPALTTGGPQWTVLGLKLTEAIEKVGNNLIDKGTPADYATGDGIIPTINHLNLVLENLGPSLQPVVPLLNSLSMEATNAISGLNISALIAQAVESVGEDGSLKLQVNVK